MTKDIKQATDALSQYEAPYIQQLKHIGDAIGYGNSMTLLSKMWRQALEDKGYPMGGEFVVGPCKTGTVPCGCKTPHKCDWCNGCGWLTEHVKSVKDKRSQKK